MASVSIALTEKLATYLKANMASLEQVHLDFPAPTQKLTYPCLTIFQNKPKFEPMPSYVVAKTGVTEVDEVRTSGIRKVVGQWEWNLQLDLWCRSKTERHALFDELFQAFHLQEQHGLSLQLPAYFSTWARFDLTGYDFSTSEGESERAEWRVKIDVLAHCFAVVETNESIFEEIENTLETPAQIEAEEAETGSQTI